MKSKHIILLLLLFTQMLSSQSTKVIEEKIISSNVIKPLSEPHLVTNPKDPNHLIIATIITDEWIERNNIKSHILLLQSHDGAKTWQEIHFNDVALAADPWLSINNKGTIILSMLGKLKGSKRVHMLAYISTDEGKTWTKTPLDFGNGHDRQSIAVDPVTQNFIIASAKFHPNADNKIQDGIMLTRLSSWGAFIETNWHPLSNASKNNGTPIFTANMDLVIPYVDYSVNNKMLKTRRHWLVKSRDLGKTISTPFLTNEGKMDISQVLLDTINYKTPTIHQLWREGALREYRGISTNYTQDNGYSWSTATDIGQYSGNAPYMREPQWIMNKKGTIGVFWFDGRVNPDKKEHHLFFSYSNDGAQTYSKPQKISSKPSKPNPKVNGMIDKRFPTGGDYFGLDVTTSNAFRVVWIDHRNGKPQLFHVIVDVSE